MKVRQNEKTDKDFPAFDPRDPGYLRNRLLPTQPYQFSEDEAIELARCKNDICYFAEKYFTIVSLDHGKIKIPLYEYQKKLLYQLQKEQFNIVLQSRQSGKTTVNTILILHYALFNRDKFIAILANKEKAAKMVLSRIKMAFEIMPRFLKQRVKEWNKTKIEFHNGCVIESAATSATSIRGESVNLLYIDEAAFVDQWEEFYASTYATITAGTTTKVILNSTANGMNHYYHIWQGAQANMKGHTELANQFVPFEVNWRDVPGRSEQWKKDTINNTSMEQFLQEQENHFLGGQNTLIRAGVLNSLVAKMPVHITNEGVKIYEMPKEGHDYIITVDSSHGRGLDYHAFTVTDITEYPFRQAAVFRDNELSTMLYPNVIYLTARQYNMAYILVENNDLGGMVVADLNYDLEYENLLSPKNFTTKPHRAYELGIRMTPPVKIIGCSTLRDIVEKQQYIINDKDTIQELSTFVARGKSYEADPNIVDATDDLVMTLVLFSWLTKTELFMDIFENKILKQDIFKQHIKDIEESMLPDVHLDDGITSGGDEAVYDKEMGMYEVGEW